jgi:hypothetical protein
VKLNEKFEKQKQITYGYYKMIIMASRFKNRLAKHLLRFGMDLEERQGQTFRKYIHINIII